MTDTIYSGSVTEFRTSLVHAATHWHDHGEEAPRSAALMASGFAYALAAILGVADDELGHAAAARLAAVADDILMNGDSAGLNHDVGGGEGSEITTRPCGCLSFGEDCDKCRIAPATPAEAEALRA